MSQVSVTRKQAFLALIKTFLASFQASKLSIFRCVCVCGGGGVGGCVCVCVYVCVGVGGGGDRKRTYGIRKFKKIYF